MSRLVIKLIGLLLNNSFAAEKRAYSCIVQCVAAQFICAAALYQTSTDRHRLLVDDILCIYLLHMTASEQQS